MRVMKRGLKKNHRSNQAPVLHVEPTILPAVDASRLPIEQETRRPIAPMPQPGYYPDYHVLEQQNFWDEATRKIVLERVNEVPPIRFFSPAEALLMKAICDRILPQDDRDEEHKVPVVNFIDKKLYNREINGYRYEDMPPDHEAHRLGLQAIEEIAHSMYDTSFLNLGSYQQDSVLKTIHDLHPPAGQEIWKKMSVHHFWVLLVQDVVEAYYAHPYAWDEIGYGGPAYPRGYMRLENGKPEPWESDEKRYDWEAPITALSGKYEPIGGSEGAQSKQVSSEGGTH